MDLKKAQMITSIIASAISGIYAATQTVILVKKGLNKKKTENV